MADDDIDVDDAGPGDDTLNDADGHVRIGRFQLRDFVNAATIRAATAVILGVVVVSISHRSDRAVAIIVAVALLASAVGDSVAIVRRARAHVRDKRRLRWLLIAGQIVAAAVLIANPDASVSIVAISLASVIAISGLLTWVVRRSADRWYRILGGLLRIFVAALVLVFAQSILQIVVVVIGFWWILQGVFAVIDLYATPATATGPDADRRPNIDPTDTWHAILRWLQRQERSEQGRRQLTSKIFYEGEERSSRLRRFSVLMALSTAIATFGMISNSTAVVIGAMLIAPLMTPIMGLAAALILGWPRRATASIVIVGLGVLGAVALSYVLAAWAIETPQSVLTNSQITSRVSPSLIDLLIALAAGAAGAFALSRPDVSDSLPGAAVAIALVPPIAVIGITLQAGAWQDALGALLLFITNFVGILLAGSAVFVMLGIAPLTRIRQQERLIKTSFAAVGIAFVIVLAPLAISGYLSSWSEHTKSVTEVAVGEWLDGTQGLTLGKATVDGDEIDVLLYGNGALPSTSDLASNLAASLGEDIELTIRVVPETQITEQGTP